MSKSYLPSLPLIHLAMRQAARAGGALELEGYAEMLADIAPAALDSAARFAGEVLSPLNPVGDRAGSQLRDGRVVTAPGFAAAYQRFREDGWVSLGTPAEFGGQGLPLLLAAAASEMWAGANAAFGMCPELVVGALALMRAHAAAPLFEQYARALASGEWTGAMALTEPQAGSDLSTLTTRAEPDGEGGWRLHGRKMFISWGDHDMAANIVHFVLARTPDAPPGVKGISLFLVPMKLPRPDGSFEDNDLAALSVEHKMGMRASPTCVMALGGSGRGARGWLIGAQHAGLACMFTMMGHMRVGVGLQAAGLCERALQLARTHARERIQGRNSAGRQVAIIEHADVRRMLLTMKALTQAARGLAYTGAAALDAAETAPDPERRRAAHALIEILTPVIKGWASEVAIEVASLGVQVHGGTGFIDDAEISQVYRDARIGAIFEGTNYIQGQDLLGRKVLRDHGAALGGLLGRIEADARTLPDTGPLATLRAGLLAGTARLTAATASLLARQAGEPELVGALAWHFLQWTGVLCGGWQLALSVTEEGDGSHARELSDMAALYATHVLPRTLTHEAIITHGAAAVTDAQIGTL